jgi:hypothetical protein
MPRPALRTKVGTELASGHTASRRSNVDGDQAKGETKGNKGGQVQSRKYPRKKGRVSGLNGTVDFGRNLIRLTNTT